MWFERRRVLCIHPGLSQVIAAESGTALRIRTNGRGGQGFRAELSHAVRAHARCGGTFGDDRTQGISAPNYLGAFRNGSIFQPPVCPQPGTCRPSAGWEVGQEAAKEGRTSCGRKSWRTCFGGSDGLLECASHRLVLWRGQIKSASMPPPGTAWPFAGCTTG